MNARGPFHAANVNERASPRSRTQTALLMLNVLRFYMLNLCCHDSQTSETNFIFNRADFVKCREVTEADGNSELSLAAAAEIGIYFPTNK